MQIRVFRCFLKALGMQLLALGFFYIYLIKSIVASKAMHISIL